MKCFVMNKKNSRAIQTQSSVGYTCMLAQVLSVDHKCILVSFYIRTKMHLLEFYVFEL